MRLTPPKKITFWISLFAAVIGFILFALSYAKVLDLAWVGLVGVLILAAGYILLTLGLTSKGL